MQKEINTVGKLNLIVPISGKLRNILLFDLPEENNHDENPLISIRNMVEEDAARLGQIKQRQWIREHKSLDKAVKEELEDYGEAYERATALRLHFEHEKREFVETTRAQFAETMAQNMNAFTSPFVDVPFMYDVPASPEEISSVQVEGQKLSAKKRKTDDDNSASSSSFKKLRPFNSPLKHTHTN